MSTLGQEVNTIQLNQFLTHIFNRNNKMSERGQRGTPIMIWGNHGLGKTQTVMDFAKNNNWKIAYCAPAQFEEMGDLHGMPSIMDPDEKISGDEYTIYSPPEWVPKEEGPGILLLDDINRADDRILRGVMQLLQNFELQSWKLPEKWQIVATANPDDGDYSVTPMDDAMLTRLMHISLKFDPIAWATWAQNAEIDKRGIDFVLTYPESITGKRTTPRSLVQFFNQIHEIDNLKEEVELVSILAKSTLDDTTVQSFISFIMDDLMMLIDPQDILNTADFDEIKKKMAVIAVGKRGEKRLDRISTITTRLYLYLINPTYKPEDKHKENLVEFLLLNEIPNDLKLSVFMDLNKEGSETVKKMLQDKRLAKLLLSSM